LPNGQGTITAIFTGLFHGKRSSFGDGGYAYALLLKDINDIYVVSRTGWNPNYLKASEREKVCGAPRPVQKITLTDDRSSAPKQ